MRSRLRGRGDLARLSTASGIASHVIGRWRDGEGRPTDVNLKRLAPALGVPYEELLKMCGYLPGELAAETDAIRQAMHAQVDAWFNSVGPNLEDPFASSLKVVGDSVLVLIESAKTAVSAQPLTPVSGAVNGKNKHGRTSRKGGDSPLTRAQHPGHALLDAILTTVDPRRSLSLRSQTATAA